MTAGNGQDPTQPWEEDSPELRWLTKVAQAHVVRNGWVHAAHEHPERGPQAHVADLEAVFVNGMMEGMLLGFFQPVFVRMRLIELATGSADASFFMRFHQEKAGKVVLGDYS
jgi:hypothetical protein